MPKSDTWPGGIGLETTNGMDSAGSCDSVVSVNSGCSDDSLEHLSAEEKACLMFLEETIESLDTEEDSGVSNDELDHLPTPGNLATKMAHLSTSLGNSKLNAQQLHKEAVNEMGKDGKPIHGYLVPTPLVLANSSAYAMPKDRHGLPLDKENFHPKDQYSSSSTKPCSSQLPSEVIPPHTKTNDFPAQGRLQGPSPRGPLSYGALVHLRKSASMNKSPHSPSVDHTIDLDYKQVADSTSPLNSLGSSKPKVSPPSVAPKPQRIPSVISNKTQNETSIPTTAVSSGERRLSDPQKVRMEALQKLGLLKDSPADSDRGAPWYPYKSQSSRDLSPSKVIKDPSSRGYLAGSQPPFSSFSASRESNVRPMQNSKSFHQHQPRAEQQPAPPSLPVRPSLVKAATLERSGVGLGSHTPNLTIPQPRSATLGNQRSDGCPSSSVPTKATEPVKMAPAAQSVSHKPRITSGFSVAMVPGMGQDRKEALKKLGLLRK